jgi:hypothetical protein
MAPSIRIFGRSELATPVHAALGSAGADAQLVGGGIGAAARPAEAPGTVDVICLASAMDVQWAVALKKLDARHCLLAVGPAERKLALAAATELSRGPDAYATWPATGEALLNAVERAREAASRGERQRRWSPNLAFGVAKGLGILILVFGILVQVLSHAQGGWQLLPSIGFGLWGVAIVLGARHGWSPRRDYLVGGAFAALGLARIAQMFLHP